MLDTAAHLLTKDEGLALGGLEGIDSIADVGCCKFPHLLRFFLDNKTHPTQSATSQVLANGVELVVPRQSSQRCTRVLCSWTMDRENFKNRIHMECEHMECEL